MGLGAYSYFSGHSQLKAQQAKILQSRSIFGMKSRQAGITGIALTLAGMGFWRLVNYTDAPTLFTSLGLHSAFSFFKALLMNNTVKIENTADPAHGRPQPTPNPTSSLNFIISTVETMARIMNPIPNPSSTEKSCVEIEG